MNIPRDLAGRLAAITLVAMDVDGVLTDGAVTIGPDGPIYRFHVHDGLGIQMLQEAGLSVAWISGRSSPLVAQRASEIGVTYVYQGVTEKRARLLTLASELGCEQRQVAYIGDDLPDLDAMQWAATAFAPANAVPCVRQAADYVTVLPGGRGAVREICDLILRSRCR
jgi:3-deoxy-D-manno-octulosonate 8-phosphate phosphatase (KDO 8-P phosphatase)